MTFLRNAWYCAAASAELGERPIARRILGTPMLFARDSSGRPRAMSDRCPHRFAPLHKGLRFGDAIECPYHGLRFELSSGSCVHNPHGDGKIPPHARVDTYPVVERDEVIWIWPGDAALADPSQIVDLRLFPAGRHGRVRGSMTMQVDYRLVLDNLLDLSHANYIHAGSLSPARAKREVRTSVAGLAIRVSALMRDVETPSSQALYFSNPRGDYHSQMEWTAPGTLRQQLAMTATGADAEAGAVTRNCHLITPETEHSTHYLWFHSRNRLADDRDIDERTHSVISSAFMTEDEPMIAACQDYMEGREFFSLRPIYLATDKAGTTCRRIMEKLIAHQGD